jgi:hypothetical protein
VVIHGLSVGPDEVDVGGPDAEGPERRERDLREELPELRVELGDAARGEPLRREHAAAQRLRMG